MVLDYVINKDGTPGKRWNPITGCKKQLHVCPLWEKCWARSQYNRFGHDFTPQIHLDRLDQPINRKKPTAYYVSYAGDAFGDWVPDWWLQKVIQVMEKAPRHEYMFLTKRPKRYFTIIFPKGTWLGTSINMASDIQRVKDLQKAREVQRVKTYWEIEPVVQDFSEAILELDEECLPDWAIIGGWSGEDNERIHHEVNMLTATLTQMDVPVWHKDNLDYGYMHDNMLWRD